MPGGEGDRRAGPQPRQRRQARRGRRADERPAEGVAVDARDADHQRLAGRRRRPGLERQAHQVARPESADLLAQLDVVDTLAVQAYRLASDERLTQAAAPSLVIGAVGVLPVILVCRSIAGQSSPGRTTPDPGRARVCYRR